MHVVFPFGELCETSLFKRVRRFAALMPLHVGLQKCQKRLEAIQKVCREVSDAPGFCLLGILAIQMHDRRRSARPRE
jgi:hypothetical protein